MTAVSGGVAVHAVAVVLAYALGTLPVAHVVAGRRGVDPTRVGSGNPGATNVMLSVGKLAGALTLAGDVLKGAVAAGIGWGLGGRGLAILCGVAAVAGHVAPVTRGFRGGKGVATGLGMAVVVLPVAAAFGVLWFSVVRAVLGRPSIVASAGLVALPGIAAAGGARPADVVALGACASVVLLKLWLGGRGASDMSAGGGTA